MIDQLEPNQIFVFGSNRNGYHAGGAARQAFEDFGAVWGECEGLFGQSYAFPTLGKGYKKLTKKQLIMSRALLYRVAKENPDKEFLLTPVGTGIAGYTYEEITPLFENLPVNIKKVNWEV